MKITLQKELLLRSLGVASRFSSSKIGSSIALQGVLIQIRDNKFHITSTNLVQFFTDIIQIEKLDEKKELNCVIEYRKVIEFLQLLDNNNIECTFTENLLSIDQNGTKGSFALLSYEDYPEIPKFDKKKSITLKKDFFLKELSQVLFTTSKDSVRPALTGVFLKKIDNGTLLVTTDGFRLTTLVSDSEFLFENDLIIPASFFDEVIKYINSSSSDQIITCQYFQKENIFGISYDNTGFFTRIIEGQFPSYEKVIPPAKKTTIELEKQDLLKAVKIASVFAKDYGNLVIFEIKQKKLTVRPKKDSGDNKINIECVIDGEDIIIGFNNRYLIDFLSQAKDIVIIELLRNDSPAVFLQKNKKTFLHIIMPVRISE